MERKPLLKCSLSESSLAALNAISKCSPVQVSGYLLYLWQACWSMCCKNLQKGHSLYTHGMVDMWTALHNYSPFLINSPVFAETSSGSTRGTCINVHQEQWLLLQAQEAPSLMCNRPVEPNVHLHCLLGLSQSHCLSQSAPAVFKISPVPHMARRWQEVVGWSFKCCSMISPECIALVCRSHVSAVRRNWRQFWEALLYLCACSLPVANGGNENSLRNPNLNRKSSTHRETMMFLLPKLRPITIES